MSQVDDTTEETHTIEWRIENFSRCALDVGTKLQTAPSVAGNLYNTRWTLVIYPKGRHDTPDYLGFCIRRENDEKVGPETIHAKFEFSLVTCDGVQTFKTIASEEFRRGQSRGFSKFAKLEDILGRRELLLQDDRLTVRCKIRRLNPKKKQSSLQKLVTEIPIEKKTISLTIGDFQGLTKQFPQIVSLMGSKNLLSLKIWMNKDDIPQDMEVSCRFQLLNESYLHIVMEKKKSENPVGVWCSFKLLNYKKEVALERSFSHIFSKLEEEWILPYFLSTSLLEGCIEDGNRLYFEVDFTVSDSTERSFLAGDLTPMSFRPDPKETTLMEDLDNLRQNSKFSDIILRINEDRFPAHRYFLAARSPRFDEIFTDLERNVSDGENQIREVEITDVDKETMELMLRFIYNDHLEDMDDKSCLLLYSAAQKYQVSPLAFQCASVLEENLSSRTVCEVLTVADEFNDLELKMIALNFILDHYEQVLQTPEWDEFLRKYIELSYQICKHICIKAATEMRISEERLNSRTWRKN